MGDPVSNDVFLIKRRYVRWQFVNAVGYLAMFTAILAGLVVIGVLEAVHDYERYGPEYERLSWLMLVLLIAANALFIYPGWLVLRGARDASRMIGWSIVIQEDRVELRDSDGRVHASARRKAMIDYRHGTIEISDGSAGANNPIRVPRMAFSTAEGRVLIRRLLRWNDSGL